MFISLILVALAAAYVYYYNHFIKLSNAVKEAWSGIDGQLNRRYDLILQIIKVAEVCMQKEKNTLEDVVEKRNRARSATTVKERQNCENNLIDGVQTLFALVENYPELKSSGQFVKLLENLTEVENDLQASRQHYNGTVSEYNMAVKSIPSCWIAQSMQIKKKNFFEMSDLEKKTVEIDINQPD